MKKNIYPGKFIVFEGIDGSGKSTQAKLLKKYFEGQGFLATLTKEPTNDSSVSKKIRQILNKEVIAGAKELQELFIQDRKEHLEKLIIPSLKEGKIVISDRYYFSTIAYGESERVSKEWLIEKNKDFLAPDTTIIIDLDPKICIERITANRSSIDLFEKIGKLEKVRDNYKDIAKKFQNIYIIDGNEEIERVHNEIKKIQNLTFNKVAKI
ncbi:MAG: dTMP kinase [Candidatus Pacebacteria bacterium]|nr:dTMP kinase [Candidatus Paceibacterota bacterium]